MPDTRKPTTTIDDGHFVIANALGNVNDPELGMLQVKVIFRRKCIYISFKVIKCV